MTIRDVIFIICKRMKFIVIFPVVVVTLYSYWNYTTQVPTYSARAVLYTIDKGSTNINEIAIVERLMPNYQLLSQTGEVRKMASENLGESLGGVGVSISIDVEKHTMTVSTSGTNPSRVANVANVYAATIIEYLGDTMGVDNISFLETATRPGAPTGPLRQRPILVAGIISTFLGIVTVFVLEFANTTIRTPEDIEKAYNLTVLAEIGRYNKGKKK